MRILTLILFALCSSSTFSQTKLDPNNATAYVIRGVNKSKLGDDRGAIADYNKAIELDPNDATAYYNRGSAKAYLGDKKGSCLDLSKVIELDPNYEKAYDLIREYCN